MWVISNHCSINIYVASCHHAQLPKCALSQLLKVYQKLCVDISIFWTHSNGPHGVHIRRVLLCIGYEIP